MEKYAYNSKNANWGGGRLADIQVSDTQVPDIQAPGRPGFQTSRSFGHPGHWTRVAKCQILYTDKDLGSKFYPKNA